MKRSNLIPITRIYDIYPKYTYSEDVKKFMDEIVDIDRANVYTKDEVITILTELQTEIKDTVKEEELIDKKWATGLHYSEKIIQQKINDLDEIKEVINCDADAETKCKMISNILTDKPHYFDKTHGSADKEMMEIDFIQPKKTVGKLISINVLEKIRAEIERHKSTIGKAISEDELKIEGMKVAYTDCLRIIGQVQGK